MVPGSYNDAGTGDYHLKVLVAEATSPLPEPTPATESTRTMSIGEEVEGTIATAGEVVPWVLEVEAASTVDIYMWSETGYLDTFIYVYEDLDSGLLRWNDDNASAIRDAVSDGVITSPAGGNYNSAVIGMELEAGTYLVVPGSYNDAGTGDYHLKVVR